MKRSGILVFVNEKVYLETTVISYLAGHPSRDLVVAAHQEVTHQWWEERSRAFDLVISELVEQEVRHGAPDAADRRLRIIERLPMLALDEEAAGVAGSLIEHGTLPREAAADALHIAVAAVNGVDYLLTWNCRHLANASLRVRIEAALEAAGHASPIICTPEELME